MHEISLVRAILSQVLTAAEPWPPSNIRNVILATGPLSGVEPVLLRQAFDRMKFDAGLTSCDLLIDEQKLEAECRSCQHSFEVRDFVFRCPRCQSGSIRVTRGDEIRLLRLEVNS